MAYISILVPAFYTKETDENEIKKLCSFQFEKTLDEFELKHIEKSEYAIKFKQSELSLSKIEDLVYQRDCIKSVVEKTFESLQSMMDKLVNMEKDLKTTIGLGKQEDNKQSNQVNDNQKLKDLLTMQLENSENFRMNTERTLNRIKEEFQQMVLELDVLRKQTSKHKPVKSMDFQHDKNHSYPSSNLAKKHNEGQTNNKNVPKLKLNK